MKHQAIRKQLIEIDTLFGNRISDDIKENLRHIDSCYKTIRENHSAMKTHDNEIFTFPNEFQGKRIISLQEVLDETRSTVDLQPKKKKFFHSKDDLHILEAPTKVQQNDTECALSRGWKKSKIRRPQPRNVVAKDWSLGEEALFYRGQRRFGTNFSQINTSYLPHRTTKEIHKFFRSEDSKNHTKIDTALKIHRERENILITPTFEDVSLGCSLSIAETCDDCNQCANLFDQMNHFNDNSQKNREVLPSLDEVMQETSCLKMEKNDGQGNEDLIPRFG